MIHRLIQSHLRAQLQRYPAVALLGARQTGKTTLAKSMDGDYFDLESDADCVRLEVRWADLENQKRLVILDEAQAMPSLFPRLRAAIDANRKRHGRFLLLGSVSPALMREVGQALTGRLALCRLAPLLAAELPTSSWQNLWLYGGYPDGGVLDAKQFPDWQHHYLDLMTQRDLPGWGLPARPQTTSRLLKMVATLHGQLWNASQVGRSLGLSYHTVNSYLDFLEQTYLLRRLPAYSANLKKRLVKSPKVYWRDTGLLHALLALGNRALLDQPWVGASWEGWVIEQTLSWLEALGKRYSAFHFRTSDQKELDLVLELGRQRLAVDIKLTSSPGSGSLQQLQKHAALIEADRAILVSQTQNPVVGDRLASVNLQGLLDILSAIE